ncbi:hypothetical protein [Methylomonas sp. 11b]|uniref:hypothetical protein n=2 Tax=unclassified Methylomonas TaxID=2608980 RepID=UPI00047E21A2|nr:hypothetical protein [Methylomonas sp. 11b]
MTSDSNVSSITIKLHSSELVRQMLLDLRTAGVTPVMAVERALETHLFKQFRDELSGRLVKSPVVLFYPMYFKERYATLHALSSTGYDTWYTNINFATRQGDKIDNLKISSDSITMLPIDYGFGVYRSTQIKTRHLKRQTNHEFRINHLLVTGQVFQEVTNRLISEGDLKQPLVANFTPTREIVGFRTVSFVHMITGSQLFCVCAKPFHMTILSQATSLVPQYVEGSWPQEVVALLKDATYAEDICHLCLARKLSPEEPASRYGPSIETGFEAFVDQMRFDLGVDEKTARAELKLVLGLSRWVREAELYGVIRELFPDQLVLREASPAWLGRMRIDIYLPDLKLAIEHQGEQHYRPLSVFGGEDAHERVLKRDILKRALCKENGIAVIDVRYDEPITKASIRQRVRRFLADEFLPPIDSRFDSDRQ